MVVPMIWQTVHDALLSSDNKLCEMGKVFGLNNALILFKIKIPSCINEIISACVGGLGFAWKSGVAAEVLCTPAVSLGKSVYRAKANLDFAEVYALTLTVVILSLIIEFILKRLCRIYLNGRKKEKND